MSGCNSTIQEIGEEEEICLPPPFRDPSTSNVRQSLALVVVILNFPPLPKLCCAAAEGRNIFLARLICRTDAEAYAGDRPDARTTEPHASQRSITGERAGRRPKQYCDKSFYAQDETLCLLCAPMTRPSPCNFCDQSPRPVPHSRCARDLNGTVAGDPHVCLGNNDIGQLRRPRCFPARPQASRGERTVDHVPTDSPDSLLVRSGTESVARISACKPQGQVSDVDNETRAVPRTALMIQVPGRQQVICTVWGACQHSSSNTPAMAQAESPRAVTHVDEDASDPARGSGEKQRPLRSGLQNGFHAQTD
ncbi:hypothetical protein BC628DRAFT_1339701 [Trametes gibbosa]|nr:hypothetical protein BC628DRAFT_1339701 [Trametes gibbosa]